MVCRNALIYTGSGYVRGSFSVVNGVFGDIVPDDAESDLISLSSDGDVIDLGGRRVLPGLTDIHIHGAAGADLSDGNTESIERMASYLAEHGVTSFAPASVTQPYDRLAAAFDAARRYGAAGHPGLSRLAGIHMEGPYLSDARRGAQNPDYLRDPDIDEFRSLYETSGEMIRIVDVAPELTGAGKFTSEASRLCRVSVSHTNADHAAASRIFDAGASHLTHLFNAMSPIHHREPGVIGAASERDDVTAELICDGLHVHPSAVRMAFKLFPGRICLISDALRCMGMPDGRYDLGGQTVTVENSQARLSDGTLAGSCTDLFRCMKNAIRFGIPEDEAIRAATIVPAECIGMDDEIGSIAPGKAADFIVCDDDLDLKGVFIGGVKIR